MKKVLALVVMVALLLVMAAFAPAQQVRAVIMRPDGSEVDPLTPEDLKFFENQTKSNDAYSALLSYFAQESGTELLEAFPPYYAGARINKDGSLTIRVFEASDEEVRRIREVCDGAEVVFEEADCSLTHLFFIRDDVEDILFELQEEGQLVSFGISVLDASGTIEIRVESQQSDSVRQVLESRIAKRWPGEENRVIISASEGLSKMFTILHSGDYIYATSSGTLGFRAKYNLDNGETKYGFVTAAHVVMGSSHVYDSGNQIMGDPVCWQDSGRVDAAFVEVTDTSNWYVSNVVHNTYVLYPNAYYLPASGTICYMAGYISGLQSGYIQTTYWSGYFPSLMGYQYYTNIIQTSVSATNGDSGAMLYALRDSTYVGVIGVLMGGDTTYTYFTWGAYYPWSVWPY